VDALAARDDDGRVTVLAWRHTDDQYQRDDAAASVRIEVQGLTPGLEYTVTEHRIDAEHSNAHPVWRSLGAPQRPTDEQLATIRSRQGLESLAATRMRADADGTLVLTTELPLPSVSAFEVVR
jgi:xylan 1,4-beta-xylosidase